jgi:vitamin B12 transport system permease protein
MRRPASPAHATGNLLFAVLCAIMVGLAAGAVWMVVALYLRGPQDWLALPAGALIGWTMRAWIVPTARGAAALAAITTLLAAGYMRCLLATANVAASMGTGFADALHRAGPAMLLDLARLSMHWSASMLYLLGAAVAAWVAWRGAGRQAPRS